MSYEFELKKLLRISLQMEYTLRLPNLQLSSNFFLTLLMYTITLMLKHLFINTPFTN